MMVATAMAVTSTAAARLKPAISEASQAPAERAVAATRLVSGIGGTDTTAASSEVARDSRTETDAGDDATRSSEAVGRTGVGSNVSGMSVAVVVANVIVTVDDERRVVGTKAALRVVGLGTGVVVMRPTHGS